MRLAGRMAPGSCGAVRTGQSVFSSPALTALTRAILSFLVRPFMVGTVMGGLLAAESLPVPLAVLDAATPVGDEAVGLVEELAVTLIPAAEATEASGGTTSPPGVGRASLLAAQAREAKMAKGTSAPMDEYLLNKS